MNKLTKITMVVFIIAILIYFLPKVAPQLIKDNETAEILQDTAIAIATTAAAIIVFSVFSGVFAIVGGLILLAVAIYFVSKIFKKSNSNQNEIKFQKT